MLAMLLILALFACLILLIFGWSIAGSVAEPKLRVGVHLLGGMLSAMFVLVAWMTWVTLIGAVEAMRPFHESATFGGY